MPPRVSLTGRGLLGNLSVAFRLLSHRNWKGSVPKFLLRVTSGPREGERIELPAARGGEAPQLVVGRGAEAEIRFADSTLSRSHAILAWEAGAWHLVNQSRHGSYHGRKHLVGEKKRRLRPGDELVLGETHLVFESDSLGVATPGGDTLLPETPTIARAPSQAGYDAQGKFHTGQTLLTVDDPGTSFLVLGGGEAPIRVKKRQLYFLAIVLVLGAGGCLATGLLMILPTLMEQPRELLIATAFGVLPALPYVVLFKFLDRNDQIPWRNLLACATWGATVGCGAALVINSLGSSAMEAFVGAVHAWNLTAIFLAPLTEEVVKGMAVLIVFWILHDEFDNVIEGLILGAASGLGFAIVENCIYNVGFLMQGGGETLLVMGTYRSLVNALIGHPIYTAMTGAGLGLLRETRRDRSIRYLFPLLGLLTAIGMHVAWNAAAVYLGRILGDDSGFTSLLISTVLFGGAGLLFFVAAYVFAAGRERRVLVAYLSEEVGKGFVEAEELASFAQWLGRLRYELGGLFRHGVKVYLQRKTLRRAQVELAFRKWHLAQGDASRGQVVDAYIKGARERIRDARNRLNQLEGKV
jgi:RsiW-degrading membrane proteinase PrsW (M82 family)